MQVCSTREPGQGGSVLDECRGGEGECLSREPTPAGKEEAWLNPGRQGAKHAGPGLPPGPGGPLNTPASQGLIPTGRDLP